MGVRIESIKRRGFLRQICQSAKKSSSGVIETLVAAQSGHFTNTFSRGRLVISQSGSGQSGSFQVEMPGAEWTPSNVFGLIEELIELAESLAITDDGEAGSTDALFAAMVADGSMQSSRVQHGDFTLLGVPNAFGSR